METIIKNETTTNACVKTLTSIRKIEYYAGNPIIPFVWKHKAKFVQYDSNSVKLEECKPRPTWYVYGSLAALFGFSVYKWYNWLTQ